MRYLLFLFVFISSITLAQNGINYQGAATDSDGAKLANQNVSLRTSVLQGGVDGTTSYSETHNTTTDQFGLFNVVIGQGEVVSGDFEGISWGADAHFLKVELDATGGSDYSLVSTTQMMSVPYALYAENANINYDSISNLLSENNSFIDCGFGDFETVNIIFPDGPNYSYFKEALTDQIILGQLANGLQYQAMVEVWTDTTLTEDQGKIFSIGSSNGVYTIPIKKGQFYRLPPWTSFQFLGSIPINCGSGGSSSSSSLDSAMVAEMIASMNISGNNISNCDYRFPNGLNGEFVSHHLSTRDYVVPENKQLFISSLNSGQSTNFLIDDKIMYQITNTNIDPITLHNPLIIDENSVLSMSYMGSGVNQNFFGLLMDKNQDISPVTINTSFYTVPENKKLVLMNIVTESSQADINGLQLRMKYGYTTSLSSPIILDPGSTIQQSSSNAFNGYLVDEDYFENCGGGGGSVSSFNSGVDSAMVADMIAGTGALGSSFGEFISINSSIENQATQDGFLYGNYYCGGSSNSYIKIYCDTFTGNETQRAYIQSNPYGGNFDRHDVFMIPVKKGEYYSFDTGGWNSYITDSYFIPLTGSGTNPTINESSGLDSAMVAEMINQALENNVNGIGIGDYFQGGIVAYIFDEDDAGYVEGEVHGYIISNETYNGIWGCYGIANNINGQNGLENSISISNLCPSSTNQVGGGSCSSISSAEYWLNYSNSGYEDWFLPSFYEVSKVDWSNISVQGIDIILVSNDYNAGGWSSWNGSLYNNQYNTTSGTYDLTTKTNCVKSLGFRIF